ncbi:putative homogentisate phytyltransferase 1 [Cardiosporidium cionae]|uniref:Homogentisate phytyltransferase 1 n=1 Tax=Cardiosporidium cionae TaxID=476202 RepID=A0ABQ7J6W5_9APIC|nr:putative homogentisate phytyltransferase 1 [Cardiosporidium cionae]|eukprot:KAF8819693.1 putative homogentisate phytyltransferase 1 [Cardiosporidium cionae]
MNLSQLKNLHILQFALALFVIKLIHGSFSVPSASRVLERIFPSYVAGKNYLKFSQCSHKHFCKSCSHGYSHGHLSISPKIHPNGFFSGSQSTRMLFTQHNPDQRNSLLFRPITFTPDNSLSLVLHSTREQMAHTDFPKNPKAPSFSLISPNDFPLYAAFRGIFQHICRFFSVLWMFGRPHTLIGTTMAVIALHIAAMPEDIVLNAKDTLLSFTGALISSLCMNIYVTGLNQMTDIGIDQINKPYLPLPAKILQTRGALFLTLSTLFISSWIGMGNSVFPTTYPLRLTLLWSFIFGSVYSLPPFRLKRYPVLAAACIVFVRGILANLGIYAHAKQAAYHVQFPFSVHTFLKDYKGLLITAYFSLYGTMIAVLKDVPDLKGDKKFGIRNFTVSLGPKTMFNFCRQFFRFILYSAGVMLTVSAIRVAQRIPLSFWGLHPSTFSEIHLSSLFTASWVIKALDRQTIKWFHALFSRFMAAHMAFLLAQRFKVYGAQINPRSAEEVTDFYMNVWKLFYMSYATLILLR